MSVLLINGFKSHLYSKMLSEIVNNLVVLSKFPLPDSNQFRYFEIIPDLYDSSYVEIRALELNRIHNFERIVSGNEFDLILAGRLRERLGLPGQTEKSALAFRDKVLMKDILSKHIKVPAYQPLDTILTLFDFIDNNGYPVLVKPRSEAGSQNIQVISNYQDFVSFSKTKQDSSLEVEKFISGQMYHVDAIIDNGNMLFLSAAKLTHGCLGFKENKSLISSMLHPEDKIYKLLANYFTNVIKLLPLPEVSAYHLEVFHTEEDELILCEIASRVGGAFINDYICLAYGINMMDYCFRRQCDLNVSVNITETMNKVYGSLFVPPKKGKLLHSPDKVDFPWVDKYTKLGEEGQLFVNPKRSGDFVGAFIIHAESSALLEKRLLFLDEWYREQIEWEEDEDFSEACKEKDICTIS